MKKVLTVLLISGLAFFSSCDNDNEAQPAKLTLQFQHLIDGEEIVFDEMIYTNAAGNECEISEIQWFISDVTLVAAGGDSTLLDEGGFAHYIDTDIPGTWTWNLPDDISPGAYSAIKMTFGLKGAKNIPYSFPNPPESDMIWPYHMGGDHGGYHYMKLNGFWMNTESQRMPFNFHIGVGQIYEDEDSRVGGRLDARIASCSGQNYRVAGATDQFIQNWFEVVLPLPSFTIASGEVKKATITMNVENWFQNPHAYDHNVYGGMIMMNQEAMGKISENGHDVFTIEID